MLSEIPDDEFAAALDACAAEVLWEAGVDRAAGRCAGRGRGLGPGRRPRLRDALSGPVRAAGGARWPAAAARARSSSAQAERPEREQWAVAHEIGESVAYRVFERLGVSFDEALPTARELVANRLASCSAVAAALVCGRRPRPRLGLARAQGSLRHREPRADRAADAGDAAADRDYRLRPGPRPLAAKQRDGPPARDAARGEGRLARMP